MHMQRERSIAILLIDDHAVLRAGLRAILNDQANMYVVEETGSGQAALVCARATMPNIILFSPAPNDPGSVELVADLVQAAPQAGVILLTMSDEKTVQLRALRLGALGLVYKEQAFEVLLEAIEAVYAGNCWLDHSIIAGALSENAMALRKTRYSNGHARIAALTKREREVIQLIGEGINNQQLAERLQISQATARHHLSSVYAKLGVDGRYELVIFAYRHGLAVLPK